MSVGPTKRFLVFKRDNFTCQYCGRKSPEAELECDHVIPRKRGGPDEIENLITSCFQCNRGKRTTAVIPETAKINYAALPSLWENVWECDLCGITKTQDEFPEGWEGWDNIDLCGVCVAAHHATQKVNA